MKSESVMTTKRVSLLFVLLLFGCCTLLAVGGPSFTVASYNLRYINEDDARRGDGWARRVPVIANLIRYHEFHIFGTQEGYRQQLEELKGLLPGYDYIGVGRDDGQQAGEHAAIFFRTDLFELLEQGHFWLSQTPQTPSVGWDAVLPRICSWGHFRHRESGFQFLFFNLHMDHVGIQARLHSAQLVLQQMQVLGKGLPAILTGDFNVDQTHPSYRELVAGGSLRDAYEVCDLRYAQNGTFNSFKTENFTESRIDHVFLSPVFHVHKYGVLTDTYWATDEAATQAEKRDAPQEIRLKSQRPRLPSDHYPVVATLMVVDTAQR